MKQDFSTFGPECFQSNSPERAIKKANTLSDKGKQTQNEAAVRLLKGPEIISPGSRNDATIERKQPPPQKFITVKHQATKDSDTVGLSEPKRFPTISEQLAQQHTTDPGFSLQEKMRVFTFSNKLNKHQYQILGDKTLSPKPLSLKQKKQVTKFYRRQISKSTRPTRPSEPEGGTSSKDLRQPSPRRSPYKMNPAVQVSQYVPVDPLQTENKKFKHRRKEPRLESSGSRRSNGSRRSEKTAIPFQPYAYPVSDQRIKKAISNKMPGSPPSMPAALEVRPKISQHQYVPSPAVESNAKEGNKDIASTLFNTTSADPNEPPLTEDLKVNLNSQGSFHNKRSHRDKSMEGLEKEVITNSKSIENISKERGLDQPEPSSAEQKPDRHHVRIVTTNIEQEGGSKKKSKRRKKIILSRQPPLVKEHLRKQKDIYMQKLTATDLGTKSFFTLCKRGDIISYGYSPLAHQQPQTNSFFSQRHQSKGRERLHNIIAQYNPQSQLQEHDSRSTSLQGGMNMFYKARPPISHLVSTANSQGHSFNLSDKKKRDRSVGLNDRLKSKHSIERADMEAKSETDKRSGRKWRQRYQVRGEESKVKLKSFSGVRYVQQQSTTSPTPKSFTLSQPPKLPPFQQVFSNPTLEEQEPLAAQHHYSHSNAQVNALITTSGQVDLREPTRNNPTALFINKNSDIDQPMEQKRAQTTGKAGPRRKYLPLAEASSQKLEKEETDGTKTTYGIPSTVQSTSKFHSKCKMSYLDICAQKKPKLSSHQKSAHLHQPSQLNQERTAKIFQILQDNKKYSRLPIGPSETGDCPESITQSMRSFQSHRVSLPTQETPFRALPQTGELRDKFKEYTQRKKFVTISKKPGPNSSAISGREGDHTSHAKVPFKITSGVTTTNISRLQGDLQESSVYSVRSPHNIRQKSLMTEMEEHLQSREKEQRESRILNDYFHHAPKMEDKARVSCISNSRKRQSRRHESELKLIELKNRKPEEDFGGDNYDTSFRLTNLDLFNQDVAEIVESYSLDVEQQKALIDILGRRELIKDSQLKLLKEEIEKIEAIILTYEAKDSSTNPTTITSLHERREKMWRQVQLKEMDLDDLVQIYVFEDMRMPSVPDIVKPAAPGKR